MAFERNVIIAVLKMTKDGPVLCESINKEARVPSATGQELLRRMQKDGLIQVGKGAVEASASQRLRLAVEAINQGADLENVSSCLSWQEFEAMATDALRQNGFAVQRNLRFRHSGRRWEIDVVGCRQPMILCIDCKHWHHGMSPSSVAKVAEKQVERTSALAESLPALADKISCSLWAKAKVIPIVLSLLTGRFKFHDDVPVVSVLQFQGFLGQLPVYVDSLKHFTLLEKDLRNRSPRES